MKNIRASFWLLGLLVASFLTATAEGADASQTDPLMPAFFMLSEELLLDEVQRKRAHKIRQSFEESGMTQEELGQAIGMDQSQLSKHLRGKLPWREKWLARLAEVWKIPLFELLSGQPGLVPIASKVGAVGEFPYPDPDGCPPDPALGLAPALPTWTCSNGFYVLEISEELAVFPTLRPGTLLYVEKGGGCTLAEGQLGVEVQGQGVGRLALVRFSPDREQVYLNFLAPRGMMTVHPVSHLTDLDRVAWVRL